MKKRKKDVLGYIGLLALLVQLVFIGLKLNGAIIWGWAIVLLPCMIYAGLIAVMFLIAAIIAIRS